MTPQRSVTVLLAHIVWSTRLRVPSLSPASDAWLMATLDRYCAAADAKLMAVGVANDHVHTLVRWEATAKLCDVVQRMKGSTSRAWNVERPASPILTWQDGYWAETVSPHDIDEVKRYCRAQRARHADPTHREAWQITSTDDPR